MESVAPILGMSMMMFGLVMLVVSLGALIYGLGRRYRGERPAAKPVLPQCCLNQDLQDYKDGQDGRNILKILKSRKS